MPTGGTAIYTSTVGCPSSCRRSRPWASTSSAAAKPTLPLRELCELCGLRGPREAAGTSTNSTWVFVPSSPVSASVAPKASATPTAPALPALPLSLRSSNSSSGQFIDPSNARSCALVPNTANVALGMGCTSMDSPASVSPINQPGAAGTLNCSASPATSAPTGGASAGRAHTPHPLAAKGIRAAACSGTPTRVAEESPNQPRPKGLEGTVAVERVASTRERPKPPASRSVEIRRDDGSPHNLSCTHSRRNQRVSWSVVARLRAKANQPAAMHPIATKPHKTHAHQSVCPTSAVSAANSATEPIIPNPQSKKIPRMRGSPRASNSTMEYLSALAGARNNKTQ